MGEFLGAFCGVSTLVDVLCRRAQESPSRIAYRFLADGEVEEDSLSYAELDRRARALGAFLREMGAEGERALLLYPPGLEFVTAFLGCLYGGVVAVPAYPPRSNRPDSRLQAIAEDARPRLALTTPALRDRAAGFAVQNPSLAGVRWIATAEITGVEAGLAGNWRPADLDPDWPAFLQYTSGSTATPKGVVVRHGNLVHNEGLIQAAFGQSEDSVIVGWLPLYHDMGLIGNVLQPLYCGATCVLMSPVAFLQQPVRWLRAIDRYRATTSGGPNFAYELCVRKVGPEERRSLDLSSWQVAFNGAEPVRAETLERFAEVFAPCGFRREAFFPCYGLAEATLFVSGGKRGAGASLRELDAGALERNLAQPARPESPSRWLVGCGHAPPDQRVVIADPESRLALPEGQVGEVWISGPSVAGGYWNRPEETERMFGARLADGGPERYLRTGDLGFLVEGSLFLTGRVKDLIILRGRNLYPQDIERTVERSHPALRPGCGAAFAVEVDGEERLVVVQEVERDAERRWSREPGELREALEAVRRAVAEEHEAAPYTVVLVRIGTVPKTSSGKIRRGSCREDFLAGRLEPVGVWSQGETAVGEDVPWEAPRTVTEQRLERIWAEVFGLERVGVDQDLFELGGDSLKAAQLLARVQDAFGTDLPLDALFVTPTIAGLAAVLEHGQVPASAVAEAPRLAPVPRPPRDHDLPLSFAQRRLWFLHQLDPDNPVHNIAAAVRLEGRLDIAALAQAFSEILARHEALRTGFPAGPEDEPRQVIFPAAPLPLPVVDLSGPAKAEARRIASNLARLPFDLERGPFLRTALLRLAPEEHELVIALHHIAADGGSLGVLVRELAALYTAFAEGRPSPLAPLPVQYADYAVWQRRWLDAGALETGLGFWLSRLSGELPVVDLPADRPRPAVLSHRGAHFERMLPARLTGRLEELARRGRATPFMALFAVYTALLHRYTGLEDLVVGSPIAGRNRVELEGLIGVFINNLVLRVRLDGEPGLGELLARVRETSLEAFAHQEVPFERLVDELRPGRDLSRTPLFQVMFVGQNAPLRRIELPGLALSPREVDLGTARFDLSLSMGEADGGWLGTWKFSTDLFDAPTLARMAVHFENLLAAAVAEPGRPVAELPLLGASERHQVALAWNDTSIQRHDVVLHELIAAQVERTPDAIAVEFGDERLTYEELSRRADGLARHLRGQGVQTGSLVGISAERSIEMVVGLLGIMKAGGAYVPFDPSYPADRLAYMREDSKVGVLLTQSELREPFPELDSIPDTAVPSGPAYAIYTSGSTGRPKGAAVPHRGIVNRLLWMQEAYRLGPDDRVLQKTPFSFDVSVWEFFWPLITGARLVVAPPGAHQDAPRLAALIREHGITTLHFVPSMLQIFLDQDGLAEACRSVRRVFASGEALPFELKERFLERLPGVELHNLYGPTEASVDVTFHACAPGGRRRTVPIGRPIANTSIVVLDRNLGPVPIGIPGELHIGGVGLAIGYVGRPELTAERFIPDPIGETPGGRLYKTGDLARFRPDGEVEFLGRLDHQVKIRGVRIELGEIEAALAAHPAVRDTVVLARKEGLDHRLVAYLVPTGEVSPGELRSYLRESLPEAMVPTAFVALPAFPLNPSGKVDRKALPAPTVDRPEPERAYEAPRTPLERRLATLWEELLGVGRVGVHDNFFELGGDSIQAALFINRLQRELGRIVYVMALFDAPTVAELAAYLRQAYPDAVGRLGEEAASAERPERSGLPLEAALEELRSAVSRRLGRASLRPYAGPCLPRAVFLLSPFRSGSTLLRVMLAGHPRLFAPPELELLAFDTLGERRDAYSGRNRFATEGLLRAVMELRGCDAGAARETVGAAEENDVPVAEVYARLQEWAGGRLLVDKTPSYALDRAALARAEELFEEPLYVHLVRHPRATVDSYVEARMDRVYQEYPFAPEEQAEMVWLLGHRNILEHLARVPEERRHRLLFEDLVKSPAESMKALCRFLGLGFEPAMLDPYEGRRMTDGLHAGTRMMGDPKFHQHQGIDASVADRWRSAPGALRRETGELAADLGYPSVEPPLSFSQERLWFLAQLDPESPAYNMPAAVHLAGGLDVPALARSFAEVRRRHEVLRTVFPAVEGRPVPRVLPGGSDPLPVMDLSGLPPGLREDEQWRLALEEGRRPFDLVRGPMLRTSLLRLSADEHVLLVTMHHIASDGWTIGILIRELEALYGAFSRDLPSPLPELPLQYVDYAAWQRRWLDGEAMEGHLSYWRRRLAGRLPVLEMPTDRPRPAVMTSRGARFSRTVPAAATEEVRNWSQREGVTLFLTLLAAFNALLHRYTGQEDLLLGVPIANRNRLETEGLIGFFLNMVVQRTDASGNPAFRELLARVCEGFLGSTPHQEVPFEKLVEDLQPERDLSRTPIFQVQFSLQNTPGQALELPGLTLTLLENHNRTTKFDFTVFLFDEPEGLRTTLEYNADLFDAATMDRLLRHWETLLTGAVAAPGLRLGDLPLLTGQERLQLLTGWNAPGMELSAGPALHRIFEEQAALHPDATAVVYEVEELSYRKLNERANRLARRLRALGVGPDVPVGLCVERSVDLIVGVLGILKAGGAYVPLDPAYPPERLAYTLEDALNGSAAPVLVTQEKLAARFQPEGQESPASPYRPAPPYRVVRLDADRPSLAEESPENLPDVVDPGHLAYVIYTSGSTGRPKGVPVPHANAVRLFSATGHWFGFGPRDVWTMFHSAAFDFSVWEIWGALLFGGRLVVVPREATLSPAAFRELLVTEGVTVLNQTPSAFRQLIRADEEEGYGRLNLRWVVFGGEALDLAALAPWIERHGDEAPELINMYGITETTVHVTWRRIRAADLERSGTSPVGVPIPDLEVHLLGHHGELLPVGIPGEIHVGGAGLARGYLGRPALTAERFIPDPFSGRPGARLYRSGDLARRRPDGDVEYLGRIDGQVKIRGFRIELGEIEAALNRHPGVRESVVMALPDAAAGRRLVAYAVPREREIEAADLREHLRQSLPEYMVPAAFVALDRLPLTGNGKVDRRALPAPEAALQGRAGAKVAPRSRTEVRLAAIWREVLRLEEVGVHDNFFEVGGHSLLVAQLASRVRGAFGVELPLRAIFEAPDLEGLAARLEALLPEGGVEEVAASPIPRAPRDGGFFPLSFAQERLWFLDRLEPGSPLYNVPVALRLRGRLSAAALAATFREVVRRHESLRTSFHEVDGAPLQAVAPAAPLDVPLADLAALPEAPRRAELARLAEEEARGPFDLGRAPLLRVRLVRLAEGEHVLLATVHHIVSDGWSMGVLVREVGALYQAFARGEASPLPELAIQYADFAVWQRGWLTGEVLEEETAHWRRALAGASHVLDLPADRPRPAIQGFRGRHLRVGLPAALAEDLRALGLRDGATLFMALLAGFQTLLHRHVWREGQEDFLVGSPVANRNRREVEDLIGFFVNTLALRAPLGGEPSWRELLGRVREATLDAYAHQDLPFERLVEALEPARDLSRAPLFQVLFVLQNAPLEPLALPELTLELMEVESGTSKFDLTVSLMETGTGLAGFLEYASDLFDEATMSRLWERFRNLLESVAADPDQPVGELPLLGDGERRQVLEGWNRTAMALPSRGGVHELIAEQARRRPEAVAVAAGEERLSYAGLERRAAALARRLRRLGAGPEARVGIALERTPWMVAAVLGVMKSGAAYVPLDPSHPRERLSLILEAARPLAVVTQESLAGELPGHGGEAIWIEELGADPEAGEEAPAPLAAGHPAYVLFTSGSTGRPKGVQVPHRALLNFLLSMLREPGFAEDGILLAVTTLSFDIASLELLLPLLAGGRIELASREEAADGELLRRRLEGSGATVMQATPANWRMLLDAGWQGDGRLVALCGGEALPGELAGRLLERVGSLWNLYGPTETTVWSAARRVEPWEASVSSVAVGGAIGNTRLYVLDGRLQPAPLGVPGELAIGGLGLARGYLEAPHLTAERFVPDPFTGEAGERMYRTGDLARWRPDGRIEFLGRIDFQVKVRGFRIELGEVEAALLSHPRVRQAVAGVRGEGMDRRLVAWLVAEGPEPPAAELRAHLRSALPEFMVPSAFAVLPALPLTPSGKVDRKALPEPGRAGAERSYTAPRTPAEELIAGIWSELLGIERIGAEDSFFELGGHSLLAAQLASRLRRTFGVELPLRRVFEAPTPALLAAAVQSALQGGGAAAPPIRRRPGTEPPRLSFAQERLWFLDRLNPGSAAYNLSVALRLSGPLDLPALEAALGEIVRRHEALRTTFVQIGEEPRQVIAPALPPLAVPVPVPVVDLRGLEPEGRETEALRRLQAASERPFDLARGPLLRVLLLCLGDGEWRALFDLHHIVGDGWSTDVLVRELSALYAAFAAGRPSPLPELPVQYADFAEWQRGWLQGDALAAQVGYWRERLAGAPPLLDLPADRPRPAVQRYRGRDLRRTVSGELVRGLAALGRAEGATLFMVLLAGFETLIHRLTGRDDVLVGTPVAGRDRIETEGLIGLFLNSLALRTGLAGGLSFREALARTREAALGAFAHQDLPFEKLVEELAPARNLSHAPVYQVMLVLQNPLESDFSLPGLELSRIPLQGTTAKLDLTVNAQQVGAELFTRWLYNSDLFDGATVARLAGHLESLLDAAVADPDARLSELEILTPAERWQLLEWNATAVPYPAGLCLHELIEAQVARTPDRPAVTFGGAELSYRELDAAAGRLARRLAALGVGPDVPVGVLAERSLEMVIALLGVLKAGGAYLPLDPDYPADRLAYMLADSGVPVLLSQDHLLDRLPGHGVRVVSLTAPAEERGPAPASGVGPSNLAYVIYTSGSTGRPKGTMNTHRGIVNRLLWMQEQYGLTPEDRVLQKTPFSFDVSVWELFWPLLTGARLVMARPGGHQDPAYLVETIAAEAVTTLHFVPSMLQVFVEAPGVERCVSLQRVICSGEALPLDLARRFQARLGAGLHNLYGPTEAAVDVTWWSCEREAGRGSVPIGRPVANTQIWLLDRDLGTVPVGVPGELHIGGVQLARGYLGRPGLTAEKFIPDPFGGRRGEPGARLYKTGDLARWLPDGAVDFLGRIDHQVKIRGLRIELGEIETALAAHPAVREAAVLARAGGAAVGDVNLAAYVTVRDGAAAPELPELRALLARHLPEYMLPAALVILEAMPLSPNGKADRKALARIAPEAPAGAPAGRVAPRDGLERFLAGLFAEVLGTAGPGIHDSFFGLGGNSITGAIFINRLQRELGEIVHVVTVFDHPTVAGLATFLRGEYPQAVERLFGARTVDGVRADAGRRVDEATVAEVDRLVRKLGPLPAAAAPKNPPAVFILSPPRSGSTLLRVMLAGHPSLFAPPELELLSFDTLAERRDAFPGRDAFRLEGLLRAVMEARGCGPEEARALVEGFEAEGLTTRRMYRSLQEWIGGRTLVDKTPTYAWDPEALRRAEAGFEGARYIHLVRHPLGMVRSFEEARIDQIFFHEDHSWSRRELAEALWVLAQRNALEFLAEVPAGRRHTVVFEELLRDPGRVLGGICGFLGIPYDPAMAEPYQKSSSRMTDGLHAESRMLGDVKFHQHGRVEAGVAERWREELREESLGGPARALAARLGYELAGGGNWTPIPRVAAAPGELLPVSFSQERFWFLDQLDGGTAAYSIPAAVRLTGRLDGAALEEALTAVARRQASLRTTFAEREGRPVQVLHAPARVPLPRVDLSGLPAPTAEAAVRRLAAQEASRPFDLGAGPLFRVALVRLGPEDHALLVTMHHIVSDGWSLGVFLREAGELYLAFSRGEAPRLPELPIQYADFARWQRERLSGEALEAQLGYWRQRLAGLPPLRLPVDHQEASEKDFRAGARTFSLTAELTGRLKDLAVQRGATLFMTLLAAFQALLARHTGQADLAVGSPVAGRNRAETEGLIGFFVNTLVLRADASGNPTFAEFLTRTREASLGAYNHQEVPFAVLVEALRPERRLGRYPLVEVLFSLQNQPVPSLELPGLSMGPLPATEEEELRTSFSLSLMLWESRGALTGGFGFNTALFDRATLARWQGHFTSLLAAAVEDPGRRLDEIPLLSAEERHQLLEWRALDGVEVLLPAGQPAPIGIWGTASAGGQARRRADGSLEWPAPAANGARMAEVPERPAVAEEVARQRAELAGRRETLSASKRELLEKRLRGAAAGARPGLAPGRAAGSASPLVPLQAGANGQPPFFCVHAVGGAVFSYGELARSLAPGQAFYGIQAPGLEGGRRHDDLAAMAGEYVAAVRTVQPRGPYLLGGWSMGGVVAYEMARQLQEGGEEVALLALFDSYAPDGDGSVDGRDEQDLLRLFLLDQARMQGRELPPLEEGAPALEPGRRTERLLARAREAGLLKADVRPEQVERLLGVYKGNLLALSAYRPRPYAGRLTLFRPEEARPDAPLNGWDAVAAGAVEVLTVAGDHYTMLARPHVRILAERLQGSIGRALEAGHPAGTAIRSQEQL